MFMIFLIYESPVAPIPSEVSLFYIMMLELQNICLSYHIVYCAIKFDLHETTGWLCVRHLKVANVLRWEILHKD
jgi:hypothetical protein